MEYKKLLLCGALYMGIQMALNLGIFVTPTQIYAYAASKDDFHSIQQHLTRIENKLDKLILGY